MNVPICKVPISTQDAVDDTLELRWERLTHNWCPNGCRQQLNICEFPDSGSLRYARDCPECGYLEFQSWPFVLAGHDA